MVSPPDSRPRLGYLCGSARVSTREEAQLVGPRSHVLGVIQAHEAMGWDVTPYLVGDRVPLSWITPGSETVARSHWLKTLAVDLLRLGLGAWHAGRAYSALYDRVDIVYERAALMQAMGAPLRRAGVPWILETNELKYREASKDFGSLVLTRLARRIELYTYRACDLIVVVSEALKSLIVKEGISPDKILVLPNGVDVTLFDPATTIPVTPSDAFTIGYVGSLLPRQRLDVLIESVADLRDEGYEMDIRIVGGGTDRERLNECVRRCHAQSYVEFAGRVERNEVPGYIASFDVGYSGPQPLAAGAMYLSPLKLYEYLAMATPVVAAAYEDAVRICNDGDTGFLFEPQNPDDLKRALRRAYAERGNGLRRRGATARADMVEHHSWQARVRTLHREIHSRVSVPPALASVL